MMAAVRLPDRCTCNQRRSGGKLYMVTCKWSGGVPERRQGWLDNEMTPGSLNASQM
jgi:uncharacterized protein YodC (DUF2158 family)